MRARVSVIRTSSKKRSIAWAVTGVGVLLCTRWSSTAQACAGPTCIPGVVFPVTGTVPVNHFRLRWDKMTGEATQGDTVRVFRVTPEVDGGDGPSGTRDGGHDSATSTEAELHLVEGVGTLSVEEPLHEGDVLRVEYDPGTCEERPDEVPVKTSTTITLGSPVELPTELGELRFEMDEGYVDFQTGVCHDHAWRSYAVLDVALEAAAVPFADAFMYRLKVDGVTKTNGVFIEQALLKDGAWPSRLGGRYAFGDKVLMSADCRTYANDPEELEQPLSAGTYSVAVVAVLPDGTELETPPVDIEFECSVPVCSDDLSWHLPYPCPEGDAQAPLPDLPTEDSGVTTDAGGGEQTPPPGEDAAADGATEPSTHGHAKDAGGESSAPIDSGTPSDGAVSSAAVASDGCGCTVGGSSSRSQPLVLLGAGLGLVLAKRRRWLFGGRFRPLRRKETGNTP